jgi:uncharacterized protein
MSSQIFVNLPVKALEKSIAAGGATYSEPKDYGFMYQHGFQDLDGHIWEIFFMDESAFPQG